MHDYTIQQHVSRHLSLLTNKKILVVTLNDIVNGYTFDSQMVDFSVNIDYILERANKYDAIVIDYATTYLRDCIEEDLYNQLSAHDIPISWVILTSTVKYYKSLHPGIVYYPIHLIDGLDKSRDIEINIKEPRKNNICFLTFHYH